MDAARFDLGAIRMRKGYADGGTIALHPMIQHRTRSPSRLDFPPSPPVILAIQFYQRRSRSGQETFYDPILSADSTLSCAGCHHIEFAFTDSDKVFSLGIDGILGVRNSMPILI